MLCFADFTSFTNANSNNSYCPNGTGQQMKLSIADSPDILQFCVSDPARQRDRPTAIPTYYNPGANGYNSEAYLGNNGFYTGIAGNPALYQTPTNGAYTVVNFTNIEVTNAVGEAATGWTLVTGDAESTDQHEWINFTTNNSWSILPNTTASLYGNSCYDDLDAGDSGLFQWTGPTPPTTTTVGDPGPGPGTGPPPATYATTLATPAAPNYLTGVSSILCESDQQLNKTGTLMLASPEPTNLAPTVGDRHHEGCGLPGTVPRSAAVRRPAAVPQARRSPGGNAAALHRRETVTPRMVTPSSRSSCPSSSWASQPWHSSRVSPRRSRHPASTATSPRSTRRPGSRPIRPSPTSSRRRRTPRTIRSCVPTASPRPSPT